MRPSRVLVVALPLAAAGLAWWLLVRADAGSAGAGPAARVGEREGSAVVAPGPSIGAPLPPSDVPTEPEDPDWLTRPLALPPGEGLLKGRDVVRAVEGGTKLRFEGAAPGDLDALRRAEFPDVDRSVSHPHAAMLGWFKEAGFEVDVAWPRLIVRRRTDDDWTSR